MGSGVLSVSWKAVVAPFPWSAVPLHAVLTSTAAAARAAARAWRIRLRRWYGDPDVADDIVWLPEG